MNKTELIEEIALRTDSSKGEAQRYIESFEEVVAGTLRSGEEIQITGFGKFYVCEQKAREGVNPRPKRRCVSPPPEYLPSARAKGSRKPSRSSGEQRVGLE